MNYLMWKIYLDGMVYRTYSHLMTSFEEQLLAEIDEFKDRTGLSDTSVGLVFRNDGHLVLKLRAGTRTPSIKLADKLRQFMAEYQIDKCAA